MKNIFVPALGSSASKRVGCLTGRVSAAELFVCVVFCVVFAPSPLGDNSHSVASSTAGQRFWELINAGLSKHRLAAPYFGQNVHGFKAACVFQFVFLAVRRNHAWFFHLDGLQECICSWKHYLHALWVIREEGSTSLPCRNRLPFHSELAGSNQTENCPGKLLVLSDWAASALSGRRARRQVGRRKWPREWTAPVTPQNSWVIRALYHQILVALNVSEHSGTWRVCYRTSQG